jgi:hypothetical protein
LSISGTKTVIVYGILSASAVAAEKIYGIFGHGVTSPAMTWMFLYPLLGGVALSLALLKFLPRIYHTPGFRIWYNLYNSGIAALTAGSFLKGVYEIAGASTGSAGIFMIAGALMSASGILGGTLSASLDKTKRIEN